MTNGYLVRIELHGDQSGESYTALHLEMGKREFMRWFISDVEAGRLELPHATYVHEGFQTYPNVQSAFQAAYTAVSPVDVSARVIALEKGEAVYGPGFRQVGQPI